MSKLVEIAVDRIKRKREAELRRCYRACFLDENGNVTLEAQKVFADLRELSGLFGSAIKRDGAGRIDLELLLQQEARRGLVLRILSCLDLDPLLIGKFTEVDGNG